MGYAQLVVRVSEQLALGRANRDENLAEVPKNCDLQIQAASTLQAEKSGKFAQRFADKVF
jgi:hypothetical protein